MAFNPALLFKLQPSSLFTQPATIPNIQAAKTAVQMWTYQAGSDAVATVEAAGYFVYFADWLQTLEYNNGQYLQVGDTIYCVCSDANVWLQVTAIGSTITTIVQPVSAGSVVTSSIAANAVGSGQLATNIRQFLQVPLTLAQFTGMYAAPVQVIAAPAAGSIIYIDKFSVDVTYGSAALANGGAVGLQYGNTVHLAGDAASATIPAASFTGIGANAQVGAVGAMAVGANSATGIFISNATAPFITGTGDTFNVNLWYTISTL
jgi:hypothetical protein